LLQAASWRWNADEDVLALPLFREVQRRFPATDAAERAGYAIARIHESAGRRALAIEGYDALAQAPEGDDLATEARWAAAFAAYLGGDWTEATRRFEVMTNGPDRTLRAAAAYWKARALENASDPAGTEALRHLADAERSTYYGYMAGRRLGRPPLTPVSAGPIGTLPAPRFPDDLAGPHAERARAFARYGLRHAARRELDTLRAVAPSEELAEAYRAVGAPGPALRITGAGPTLDPRGYPLGYWDVVEPVARAQGVDPLLVLAVIRQESLFLPEAVSPADAHGLMQLLPRTARQMAVRIDTEPPDRWALRRIGLNVTLGTAFLRQLLDRYDGSEIRTLAAYNAGPDAVAKWEHRHAGRPEDEFVELISYRETRHYVKKVMSNHLAYRALYAEG
jgi:soluble lytic murein transglycosylase